MNRRCRLACVFLLASLAATAAAGEPRELPLPLDRARRDRADSFALPFQARADRVLEQARLRLGIVPGDAGAHGVRGLVVRVNSEQVAALGPEELTRAGERTVPIPPALLAESNLLELELVLAPRPGDAGRPPPRSCIVPRGAWDVLGSATLVLESEPVPLPDDLALLPLPFVDRDWDDEARVTMVLAGGLDRARVRAAAHVAGWLGTQVGLPHRFAVETQRLPAGNAVVLVDGESAAAAVGLPAPAGAAVRLVPHPLPGAPGRKLLVVEGRDPLELERSARRLAEGTLELKGSSASCTESVPAPAPPPSRWLPADRDVPVGRYPGLGPLSLEDEPNGTVDVRFRVRPDLWTWPGEEVTLDLGYFARRPPGEPAPRLALELNGTFVARLAPPGPDEEARAVVRLPASLLQGYNELRLHVGDRAARCGRPQPGASAGITPDSVLRLAHLPHYAELPDVDTFVHDGFPFTLVPDLSGTALVLPDEPRPGEVATALSFAARLASVTGSAGGGLVVLGESELAAIAPSRDVLLVAAADRSVLLRRWAARLPLSFAVPAAVPASGVMGKALAVVRGGGALRERDRANRQLARASSFAAVLGFESPLAPGASVVAVTATTPEAMPTARSLAASAAAREPGGDLLLLTGDELSRFRIGARYGHGQLPAWARARRAFAIHWVALAPALLLASVLLGLRARAGLARRVRERIPQEEARG